MPSSIQALSTEVVHLIAAGEVIDSLAAVVRELAENALDAGATRIAIAVDPEQWRIRVADNGAGISRIDLQQAAVAHSTSKICNFQDLCQINSLGFRGEALHSLAQLSDLEILSRPANAVEGWYARYNAQGEAVLIEPVAIAPGTVVIVDHLFGHWPARRLGLPSMAQQLKMIQATLHHLALCHPHVTWQVQQNDRDWFNLCQGKTARQILPQILRDVQVSDLQELAVSVAKAGTGEDGVGGEDGEDGEKSASNCAGLYLLLGLPDRCHRHRPDWVKVALNGRLVKLPELEQTIIAGFRRTLPRDRFPVCFVHLQVPPDQIDWNRHPAKTEIYLHHLDDWRAQVAGAIEQALRLSPVNLSDTLDFDRVGKLLKTAEAEGSYLGSGGWRARSQESGVRSQEPEVSDETAFPPAPQPPSPQSSLKAIAQVHNRYILAEHPSGVWLIEQHIAHERVLYEQLCDRWQLVPLEPGVLLNALALAQVEQLQRLGFVVEPFGDGVWMVRTGPALLAQREDCAEALRELSLGGDLQTAQVATACRSAIRNGTPLSLTAMQQLLDQWQQTRNPRTCPHGRPICLTLEESSLARFFRRHWVIGKSHGI